MPLSKILDFSSGLPIDIPFISALSINTFISPNELIIKQFYMAFQNGVTQSLDDYLILDIYNIGRNDDKQILISRLTTYTDDIFGTPIDSFKAMLLNTFKNNFGQKEVMKVVAYYHRTTTPLQGLSLGFVFSAIEVEPR
jgi:hypothetical protein